MNSVMNLCTYIYIQACAHTQSPQNNSSDIGNLRTVGLLMIFIFYCIFPVFSSISIIITFGFIARKVVFKYLAQR